MQRASDLRDCLSAGAAQDIAGLRGIHGADLDGDGDADVLSASEFDDTIAWYENVGVQ